ncbi:MAG: DUF4062 domain-containing protein [Candidatus Helarchaeota archaeon]
MIKIFVSSTSRDLSEVRKKLIEELNEAVDCVGMEHFVPDGTSSQEASLANLKDCDAVIFLISPHYGTLMEECHFKTECKAECPMKKTGADKISLTDKISFTHCEFKTAIAEGMPHQTYYIARGWDVVEFLKDRFSRA